MSGLKAAARLRPGAEVAHLHRVQDAAGKAVSFQRSASSENAEAGSAAIVAARV